MYRKGILILVALVIGIVTGVPFIWENADSAYFTGMGIYLLIIAYCQMLPKLSDFDEICVEINLLMCINYLIDLIAGTTQSIGINEYVLFIFLLVVYLPYRLKKRKARKNTG
jgi:hypothetical protein